MVADVPGRASLQHLSAMNRSQPGRFRFGVNTWAAASGHEWVDKARGIEALGYSTLFMPDHLADTLSPFSALAVAAQAAPTLRVGPFVLNNDFRHPVVVAREVATLDLLTDGRVEFGLGAGYADVEYLQAGLRFDRGRVRVARLGEAVSIIKGLLAGENVSFTGEHYTITAHQIHPLPVQRPRPPILIGGNGRDLLTLAAKEADIVSFTGATFPPGGRPVQLSGFAADDFAQRIAWVRSAAAGRSPELNVLVQEVRVAKSPRKAAEELASRFRLTSDVVLDSPFLLAGPTGHLIETLQARRERWGISYIVVFERSIEDFAPVVARLVGT
jgi:probable F420-dependent oxidoreductase